MGKFAYILDHLNKKTPKEFLDTLVRIGVYDEDGNLTEKYGGKKRVSKEKHRDGDEPSASAAAPSKPTAASQEPEATSKSAHLVEELNKLTPADLRQSLVKAGIIDEEGRLTEKYRQPTKKGKRKHAS